MTMQSIIGKVIEFLNVCVIYYGMQLMRCALVSMGVFAVICLLRKTLLRHSVFFKGALWSLLLPMLFVGKLKFFYENTVGIILFTWWAEIFKNHIWAYWLYIGGVFVYAAWLWARRKKMEKLVAGMEKRMVGDTAVYVTKLPITPSAVGVFRPKIVLPEIILQRYDDQELQTILLHEKTHIRLGHLWLYLWWDILRALLWLNPLLTLGVKFFREDMEEICDRVTIRESGGTAYAYGKLLLKSMKVLKAEDEGFNVYANFAGDKEFQNIRQRMAKIAQYEPKRHKKLSLCLLSVVTVIGVLGMVCFIHISSYGRWNENDGVLVYGYDAESGTANMVTDVKLQEMISYDDSYVSVDREAFEEFLRQGGVSGEIFLVFGGYYKLPGFIGYGYSCSYEFGCTDAVVRLPYDKPKESWMLTLIKMI